MLTQQEINEFFDFCSELISDSPHCGDDATCEWFEQLAEKVKKAAEKYAIIEKSVKQQCPSLFTDEK